MPSPRAGVSSAPIPPEIHRARTCLRRTRITAATDAANIVAQMDDMLRDREAAAAPEAGEVPTVDNIFAHMSAYMEAPAAA